MKDMCIVKSVKLVKYQTKYNNFLLICNDNIKHNSNICN